MNTEDSYFGHDMSNDEYCQRVRQEQERDEYYANIRKAESKRRSEDRGAYRFSSDEDDSYSSY